MSLAGPAAELWMCEQVERVAGLPVGAIARNVLGGVVLGWTGDPPGALAKWISERFEFEGSAEERQRVAGALLTLEMQWRNEQRDAAFHGSS